MQRSEGAEETGKRRAAEAAFDLVGEGMTLALGTGSTIEAGLGRLAERARSGLRLLCVPSSERTRRAAERLGLPLAPLEQVDHLDLLIDGADQIAPDLCMIKGRGGAHTREKKLAVIARRRIYVADASKLVARLGNAALPVEVLPFGLAFTLAEIGRLTGSETVLRRDAAGLPIASDNGNVLADAWIGPIADPAALQASLKAICGVVETGLFVGLADQAIVSDGASLSVKERG